MSGGNLVGREREREREREIEEFLRIQSWEPIYREGEEEEEEGFAWASKSLSSGWGDRGGDHKVCTQNLGIFYPSPGAEFNCKKIRPKLASKCFFQMDTCMNCHFRNFLLVKFDASLGVIFSTISVSVAAKMLYKVWCTYYIFNTKYSIFSKVIRGVFGALFTIELAPRPIIY